MEVLYDDASHTYYTMVNGRRIVYVSATTLISKYKQPFDSKAVAIKYAEKYGQTPEYWIKQWAKVSKDACNYGTAVHNVKERLEYELSPNTIDTSQVRMLNYHALSDGIYPELKLWHHDWKIAGRSDKCIVETVNGKRFMHIEDYKTNKELKQQSYQYKDGTFKMMKPPIAHIQDCNMQHYTLQLSLYQYMAEYLGFIPGYRKIIHIPNVGEETVYETEYLRKDIQKILYHAKTYKYIGN